MTATMFRLVGDLFGRSMWRAILLVLTALAAGCQSPSASYLLNGIGSELPAVDIERSTNLQSNYFYYLCQQAGIPVEGGICGGAEDDSYRWTLIVKQGMNDIDRRCDAYLEWLDDQKRSRRPLLSQIGSIRTATEAIISFTSTNPVAAINIVGQAFQLLTASIENYHSRLLIEVESSTVNSIVLQGRYDYRKYLQTQNVSFRNKPDAEHALRSYLRLCLPFAIETKINEFSTLGASGQAATEDNSIKEFPVVGSRPFTADTRVDVRPPNRPRPVAPGGWERVSAVTIDPATARAIQGSICLPAAEIDGAYGARTEAGLKLVESVLATKGVREKNWRSRTVNLAQSELNILRNVQTCAPGARNYLENYIATQLPSTEEAISRLIRDKYNITDTAARFAQLRPNIAAWRTELRLDDGPNNMFAEQITPDFVAEVLPAF